ncbi:MAG: hypothetical protein RL585_1375, partial [Pseudomonadota bacterium]
QHFVMLGQRKGLVRHYSGGLAAYKSQEFETSCWGLNSLEFAASL